MKDINEIESDLRALLATAMRATTMKEAQAEILSRANRLLGSLETTEDVKELFLLMGLITVYREAYGQED